MAAPYYSTLELPFKEGELIKLVVETPSPGKFYDLCSRKENMFFKVETIKKDIPEGRFRVTLSVTVGSSVLENQYDYVLKMDFFKVKNGEFKGILDCSPNWNRNLPSAGFKAEFIV